MNEQEKALQRLAEVQQTAARIRNARYIKNFESIKSPFLIETEKKMIKRLADALGQPSEMYKSYLDAQKHITALSELFSDKKINETLSYSGLNLTTSINMKLAITTSKEK